MKILGYSQSSSKPLSLAEIDSLNKEGFNAFCIMSSDLPQPIYTNEAWVEAFYKRYTQIKEIGEKNGNPIKQVKVSIECIPTQNGYDWARTIILKFKYCKDVLFYFDEPYNAVEEGRLKERDMQSILNNLGTLIRRHYVYPNYFLSIGIQKRLYKKMRSFVLLGVRFTGSSYLFTNFGRPFRFVYGQFCYWHFFSSLLYPLKKWKMKKEWIDSVYLYQGDAGWLTNLFNRLLRRFFLRTFKEGK